jgi:hypothetical protein
MKTFTVPAIVSDHRNAVTASHPMKYLVWLKTQFGREAQLWADDFSVSQSTTKRRLDIIQMVELKGTDQFQSLNALRMQHPCPEVKE